MNLQSILLLAVILLLAIAALVRYLRRPKCCDSGGCDGCSLKENCQQKQLTTNN